MTSSGALFVLTLALAQLAPENPYLQRARVLYDNLQFSEALEQLALAQTVPTDDLAQKLAVLEYQGRCYVAEGKKPEAEARFTQLLLLEPRAELPAALSPKILDLFRTAKLKQFPQGYVGLKVLPSDEGLVRAELVDPWRKVAQVVLWTRAPSGQWRKVPLSASEPGGRSYIQALSLEAQAELHWYLEAQDETARGVASAGSQASPYRYAHGPGRTLTPESTTSDGTLSQDARPAPAAPGPRWQKTAGWVAVGVGVVASAAGAFAQVRSKATRDEAQDKQWATDALAGHAQARSEAVWAAGLFAVGGAAAIAGAVLLVAW